MRIPITITRRFASHLTQTEFKIIKFKLPKQSESQKESLENIRHQPIIYNHEISKIFDETLLDFKVSKTASKGIPESSGKSPEYEGVRLAKNVLGTTPSGDLPYKFPYGLPKTPLEMIADSRYFRHNEKVRLSVTKLLTKQWCELRDFYEIYSGLKKEATRAMENGSLIHSHLELETHPVENIDVFVSAFPKFPLPSHEDQYCQSFSNNISRLISLLCHGEAREVLNHAYMNRDTSKIKHSMDGSIDETDILISGVIDLLKISSNGSFDLFEEMQQNMNDIKNFIDNGKSIIASHKDDYKLSVIEFKTRARNNLPSDPIVHAAMLQVFSYRKFLGILGGEVRLDNVNPVDHGEFAYKMLIENMKRRNLNVDKPFSPEHTLMFLRTHPFLAGDYYRLMTGENIGFEAFDSVAGSNSENFGSFDLSGLSNFDFSREDFPVIGFEAYFNVWKTPLTLRYFAARCAQLYNLLTPLLSTDCRVNYICGANHHSIEKSFHYDEKSLDELFEDSLQFWLGKRDPQPVEASAAGLRKCNNCHFSTACDYFIANRAKDSSMKLIADDLSQLYKM